MDRNFARSLQLVLKYEGGFVNDKLDPGGATNLGVTIGTARRLGIDVDGDGDTDILDIKKLRPEDVAKVYRAEYWDKIHGNELPDGVDLAVFDFAVNSGVGRASRFLQEVVSATPDGQIGPKTLAAVAARHSSWIIDGLCSKRLGFLKNLNTWNHFGKGWNSRVSSVRIEANKMAATAALGKTPAQQGN